MWSALQLTILLGVDREMAVGDKAPDDEHLLNPEVAAEEEEEEEGEVDDSDIEGGKEMRAHIVENEDAAENEK